MAVDEQKTGKKWYQVQPGNRDLAELLRQLAAKDEQIAKLKGLLQKVLDDCPMAMKGDPVLTKVQEALK
jgi:hypothetical protein